MRYYCNRQNPMRRETLNPNRPFVINPISGQKVVESGEKVPLSGVRGEIVLPPGGDYRALDTIENEDSSSDYISSAEDTLVDNNENAQGGAISQRSGYNKQLSENSRNEVIECTDEMCDFEYNRPGMINELSGSMGVMSLPQSDRYENPLMPMSSYLRRYKGKYICIDLWTSDSRKHEKCGLLADIGDDFLVIKMPNRGETTMIDLKTIRYVSIYCR